MRRLICCAAVMLSLATVSWATDTPVGELWRSPFGTLASAAVYAEQRDIWLVEGANVTRYTYLGQPRVRTQALHAPCRLAVNAADGSCWVIQALSDEVLHLAWEDGAVLSATTVAGSAYSPFLVPDARDGSVWLFAAGHLVHLDAGGTEVFRSSWRAAREAVWLDPTDGSLWATDVDAQEAVHVGADGAEIERLPGVGRVWAEDTRDGSLWYEAAGTAMLVHRAADGTVLAQVDPMVPMTDLRVSPLDGSVWVCFGGMWQQAGRPASPPPAAVRHLSASGEQLYSRGGATIVGLNSSVGACWIHDTYNRVLVLVSAADQESDPLPMPGTVLGYIEGPENFWIVDGDQVQRVTSYGMVVGTIELMAAGQTTASTYWVNRQDHTVWVQDRLHADTFLHLSPTGSGPEAETRSIPMEGHGALAMAISPLDSSWFVISTPPTEELDSSTVLRRLDAAGAELWRHQGAGELLAIDEADGSVWTVRSTWVTTGGGSVAESRFHLHHLAANGTVTGEVEAVSWVTALAVDGMDGSLWVAGQNQGVTKLLHFSPSGVALGEIATPDIQGTTSGPIGGIRSLAVQRPGGGVYGAVGEDAGALAGTVFLMSGSGEISWQRSGFGSPNSIVVDPVDASLWVADAGSSSSSPAVVHLSSAGEELWRGDTFNAPNAIDIDPANGTVWVADGGNAQIVHLGALLPFIDLRTEYWAAEAILACVDAGIVQGYWDDTYRPELPVTRDQLAVYLARGLAGGNENVPSGPAAPSFTDVDEQYWAYKYIEYCVGANIVEGYPGGGYHPQEVVNRGQMAVYLARTLVTPSGDAAIPHYDEMLIEPPVFILDVTPDNGWVWCYDHVMFDVVRGVVQGYPEYGGDAIRYHPESPVTRDQMAVFVGRAFGLVPLP